MNLVFRTKPKKIALGTLFGVGIFVLKVVLPFPFDKFLIVFQVLFLALGSLLMGSLGATFVSLVGGVLTAFWRPLTAPTILIFSLIYGLLVDSCILVFGEPSKEGVKLYHMIISLALSSVIVGLVSYYTSVFLLKIVPYNPIIALATLLAGLTNGVIGGYLVTYSWRKILQSITN